MSVQIQFRSVGDLVQDGSIVAIQDGNHGGSHPKASEYVPNGIPFVMASDIQDGHIDLDNCKKLTRDRADKLRIGFAKPLDVLLTHKGTVGEVSVVPSDVTPYLMLTPQVTYYRTRQDKLDPKYLAFAFRSPQVQSQLRVISAQSTRPYVAISTQRQLQVPWCSIDNQRNIASVLGAYDDLIQLNRRRVALLEKMARALFEEWFVRFRFPFHEDVTMIDTPYGPLPQGWTWGNLGDLVELRKDAIGPGAHLADRRYVPIECIGKRTLMLASERPWQEAQSSLQLFERDDILFGAMRAYFHKVAPAPMPGVTRSTCFVLRPRQPHLWSYSLLTLFSDRTIEYASTHSRGSTIPYASWSGSLEKLVSPIPSRSVLLAFEEVVRPIIDHVMKTFRSIQVLTNSRDLLLPRLVSGQVSVAAAERKLLEAA